MITNEARLQIDIASTNDALLLREIVRYFKFDIDTLDFGVEATKLILNKKTNVCRVNPSGTVANNTFSSNQMAKIMTWFVSDYEAPAKAVSGDVLATLDGTDINISTTRLTVTQLADIVKLISDTPLVLKV